MFIMYTYSFLVDKKKKKSHTKSLEVYCANNSHNSFVIGRKKHNNTAINKYTHLLTVVHIPVWYKIMKKMCFVLSKAISI